MRRSANVKVKAFLYAASHRGRQRLPPDHRSRPSQGAQIHDCGGLRACRRTPDSFATLDEVRSTYSEFFGDGLPGPSYDFYDPPIPIEIEGSLFWDASHAQGGRPGPQKLRPRMPVVWEIHPVT